MEKNYSSMDRPAVFDRALSLPHFDEEATLLSARPVVPLHEVKADTGSKRRRLIFGLTTLAAILVGALSATLLMQNGRNSQNADGEVSQPILSSSGAAGGSSSEPAETRVQVAREPDKESQMGEEPSARESSIKRRQTAAVSRSSVRPARVGVPDYDRAEDFENDERELRRDERRDARREMRRQNRNRPERMGDDVLRIREIFEGSPRP